MATTAQSPTVRDRFFIGGQWATPNGTGTLPVINSATEEVMGSVPEGSAEDVDRAVRAAREAFTAWSETSVATRAEALAAGGWCNHCQLARDAAEQIYRAHRWEEARTPCGILVFLALVALVLSVFGMVWALS